MVDILFNPPSPQHLFALFSSCLPIIADFAGNVNFFHAREKRFYVLFLSFPQMERMVSTGFFLEKTETGMSVATTEVTAAIPKRMSAFRQPKRKKS